mmetsp:Transcript_43670/g.72567  ORF Transcript_43670/g.72567 Transcript_43670/m.72567 type:complete len:293 (+) Transcript_43670:131-1009(+)
MMQQSHLTCVLSCGMCGATVSFTSALSSAVASSSASVKRSRARAMSSADTMSGGTNRTTRAPAGTSNKPRLMACPTIAAAVGTPSLSASSIPVMSPQPRTSLTIPGCLVAMSCSPARNSSPRLATWSNIANDPSEPSTSCATARPAAHANGLPPKVLAWSPGPKTVAATPRVSMQPMGTPPPSALADVKISGVTPRFSCPHNLPVRPTPVCTSSKMSSAPCSSQSSRALRKKSALPGRMPPSPCNGSSIMAASPCELPEALAAARRSTIASRSVTSLYFTNSKPGSKGPKSF